MPITKLAIQQFRNFLTATIEPQAGVNIFYGQNGSGKTSILESIYFLGLGRSFRTNQVQRIIHDDVDKFLVFAEIQHDSQTQTLGLERSRHGEKKIRMNGENLTSLALLAKQLPLQLLTTESHRYFHDGPKPRRQFLDWGVFHVEHAFYPLWQQFQKALKQRNASLKNQLPRNEVEIWNYEIVQVSDLLDVYRQEYIAKLTPILSDLFRSFLPEVELRCRYSRGWSQEKDLADVLNSSFSRDQQLGYTQFGPQRADLQLYADKVPVGDFLSQGQQKLAAYALHLAQGILLQTSTQQSPIYLIDDLPSELDPEKRALVATILTQLRSQVFITGITLTELSDMIPLDQAKMFHVEHNSIHYSQNSPIKS
jgi:DNA replication and repair protein RecF